MESIRVRVVRWGRIFVKPRSLRRFTSAAVMVIAAVSAAVAIEGPSGGSGLRGILPKEVPADLSPDVFSRLTGNWEKWGKGVSELVTRLYTDAALNAAQEREILNSLLTKIHTMDEALADPRYESLYGPLTTIRGRLARAVDVDLAILDTLELKPEEARQTRIKAAGHDVLDDLTGLEADLGSIPNGDAWLPYIHARELREAVASGKTDGVVATVRQRLTAAPADPQQREFLARPAFARLAKSLGEFEQAQSPRTTDENAVRQKLTELVTALDAYEDDSSTANGKHVVQALDAARSAALDGGQLLDEVVREHYMNYNVQVVASDTVLSKLVSDSQNSAGPVSDWILGAAVSGTQNTTANVSVNLLPGTDAARMELVINGVTQSNTVGVTSQAQVYTYGYDRWGAAAPLQFDGLTLSTGPARMLYIQPSQATQGINTNTFFLFRGIAQRIAAERVAEQRPQAEAIAAQRLESRVLPEFQQRVSTMVADANNRLQTDLRKRLKDAGVLPETVRAMSNNSYVRMSAQVGRRGELSGDVMNSLGNTGAGLIINLHESVVNAGVANMNFSGRTMTDDQVKAELERYFSLLAGQPVHLDENKATELAPAGNVPPAPETAAPAAAPPAKAPAAAPAGEESSGMLVFDKEDPIHMLFQNGEVRLIFRAGIEQPGKEAIPTQIITVPLKLSVNVNRVIIERGTVEIAPATQTDRAQQVIRAGVMRKKIESVIKPMVRPGVIPVKREGRPDVNLYIANVGAENGWLTIWAN